MLRFTLDTTCVIHGAQKDQRYSPHINELAELARNGQMHLAITTAFAVDQETAPADKSQNNLEWLSQQPLIETISGPWMVGYSSIDGHEELATPEIAAVMKVIQEIVMPDRYAGKVSGGEKKRRRKLSDAQHLTAHFKAGYDAFVTDDPDMLAPKRREALRTRTGIVVVNPVEAIENARQQIR